MHVEPDIAAGRDDGLPRMNTDSGQDVDPMGERAARQRPLDVDRRIQRRNRGAEGTEDPVALTIDDHPLMCRDRRIDNLVVAPEHVDVAVAGPLEQLGRPFDIGEQERDRARRERGRAGCRHVWPQGGEIGQQELGQLAR
jgi:hypothetical protein